VTCLNKQVEGLKREVGEVHRLVVDAVDKGRPYHGSEIVPKNLIGDLAILGKSCNRGEGEREREGAYVSVHVCACARASGAAGAGERAGAPAPACVPPGPKASC
jgi:hypothetical protein